MKELIQSQKTREYGTRKFIAATSLSIVALTSCGMNEPKPTGLGRNDSGQTALLYDNGSMVVCAAAYPDEIARAHKVAEGETISDLVINVTRGIGLARVPSHEQVAEWTMAVNDITDPTSLQINDEVVLPTQCWTESQDE